VLGIGDVSTFVGKRNNSDNITPHQLRALIWYSKYQRGRVISGLDFHGHSVTCQASRQCIRYAALPCTAMWV